MKGECLLQNTSRPVADEEEKWNLEHQSKVQERMIPMALLHCQGGSLAHSAYISCLNLLNIKTLKYFKIMRARSGSPTFVLTFIK